MAAIIFDFDGTIVDSFDFVAEFLTAEAKLAPLSAAQKQKLRGLSMVAMARQLGHPWWRLPWLLFKGRRQMGGVIGQLRTFEAIPEIIQKLHAEGHEMFIVSSNTVRNVRAFLHRYKLHTCFLEIYGGVGLFSKAPILRRLVKEHQLELNWTVYIGDELRDVEAAQSIKLPVIAVTWGFARTSDLEALRPTAVANSPEELLAMVAKI